MKPHEPDFSFLDKYLEEITPQQQKSTDNLMQLAAKIDEAIKAKGIGKSEFAELIGKTPSTITKWLSGTHNFTVETLSEIEVLLNIKLLDTSYFDTEFKSNIISLYYDLGAQMWQKAVFQVFDGPNIEHINDYNKYFPEITLGTYNNKTTITTKTKTVNSSQRTHLQNY